MSAVMKPLLWLPDKWYKGSPYDVLPIIKWDTLWPDSCDVKVFHPKTDHEKFWDIEMFKGAFVIVPEHLKHDVTKWKLEKSILTIDDPWSEVLEIDKKFYEAAQAMMTAAPSPKPVVGLSKEFLADNDDWYLSFEKLSKFNPHDFQPPPLGPRWAVNYNYADCYELQTNTIRSRPSLSTRKWRLVSFDEFLADNVLALTSPPTYTKLPCTPLPTFIAPSTCSRFAKSSPQ